MTTIFGAIHYLAWFSTFPTNTDLVHWRMSTVGITFIPWLFVLVAFTDKLGVNFQFLLPWIIFLFYLLYRLAREVLFALMFSTLHNLPLGAYKAVLWTSLMPHL
ncbi:hypothetical protein BDR07DRAFT_1268876 [Suillus spraguei]|nr:hypothetical protein BDR07DRAFT_1268876 [Suillus spraguei]